MPYVFPAKPYRFGQMGSMGDAAYMILKQFQFPHEYAENEKNCFCRWDSDRVFQQQNDHANACVKKHTGKGPLALEFWFDRSSDEQVLEFIKEFLKADPNVKWTGYRVLGSVHRGNGYPIFTLELFAKPADSTTEVYSGRIAPNVES